MKENDAIAKMCPWGITESKQCAGSSCMAWEDTSKRDEVFDEEIGQRTGYCIRLASKRSKLARGDR